MNPDVVTALRHAHELLAEISIDIPPAKVPADSKELAKKAIQAVNLVEQESKALKEALAPLAKAPLELEEAHQILEVVMRHSDVAKRALDAILKLSKKMAGYS